jgi:transposase
MTKHKSEDYKIYAVKYYLQKHTQKETCDIFDCSPRSLMRWVERYNKEKSIKIHYRNPISYKVKKIHINFIKNEINKDKSITLNELLIKFKNEFPNFSISLMHLYRIIKDNYISLKLLRLRHEPIKRFGKNINIKEKLNDFYKEIEKYKLEDIICIDETSINSLQLRKYCYSNVGKRCVIKTQSQEVFKKYTGVFAISIDGVIGMELYEKGGIDTEKLIIFLEKFITNKYKNKVIILDNASSDRNEKIKQLINKNNKILYSIPYQHYTNSIEQFFSKLKSGLQKKKGLKYEELKRNIIEVIKDIPIIFYYKILKGSYDRKKLYSKKKLHKRKYKTYIE